MKTRIAELERGEIDHGLIWAGLCIGLIDDVPTCAELIERMVSDCRTRLHRISSVLQPSAQAELV